MKTYQIIFNQLTTGEDDDKREDLLQKYFSRLGPPENILQYIISHLQVSELACDDVEFIKEDNDSRESMQEPNN